MISTIELSIKPISVAIIWSNFYSSSKGFSFLSANVESCFFFKKYFISGIEKKGINVSKLNTKYAHYQRMLTKLGKKVGNLASNLSKVSGSSH
jgi:hypothetical protein